MPSCATSVSGRTQVQTAIIFSLQAGTLPNGVSLSPAGILSGTPAQFGSFNFTVKATYANGCMGAQAYTLTVNCPAIAVNPPTLPDKTVGQVVTSLSVNAGGGTAPYSFAVTSGALPTGLTLGPTGAITGTPTTTGSFSFTIAASAGNCSGSRSFTLTIACQNIAFTTTSLPAGMAGIAYSQTLNVTPAAAGYDFQLWQGNLPPGLTLNRVTGVISGLAAVTGTSYFAVRVQLPNSCSATQSYSLTINCPTIVAVAPASLPNGAMTTFYSQSFSATPAGGNYTFRVTSGALPPGLTLNPATGALSGTPTSNGTFNFTIMATGFGDCTGNQAYAITVGNGCPTITLPDLPNGTPGQFYSNSVTATPSGTYNSAITSGSLPPGLTLFGAFGLIYGYPTAAGAFSFTITATDNNNCTGQRSYSMTIGSGTAALARAVAGDFDGDGKTDFALWRTAQSSWLVLNSSTGSSQRIASVTNDAASKDVIVPGDYDGDAKMDTAVFRSGAADGSHWIIKRSSDGQTIDKLWGLPTDVPVPADYDGDGKADIAVWRGSESRWYIVRSSDGQVQTIIWGSSLAPYFDVPVPADYDGDGKADVAVFRRSTGVWYIKRSSDGATVSKLWGLGTDVPVPMDYDGDGKAEIAVWRGSDTNWYVVQSSDGEVKITAWGSDALGDVPVPGDYDGDGKADIAVWRASNATWYVRLSSDGSVVTKVYGQQGDVPVITGNR